MRHRKIFLEKIASKKSFVKMFGELEAEDKLKMSHRGYSEDHSSIRLLELVASVMHRCG